jgi:integrase
MFLRLRKGIYQLHYHCPELNKWRKVTTKCSSLGDAKKFKKELEKKILIETTLPNLQIYKQPTKLLLSQLKEKIQDYNKYTVGKSTCQISTCSLENFIAIVGDKQVSEVKTLDVEKFKHERSLQKAKSHDRTKAISAYTLNKEITNIRTAFNLAIKWDYLTKNPATDVKKLTLPEKEISIISEQDFIQIIKVINEDYQDLKARNQDTAGIVQFLKIVLFAWLTGARLNEILHLQFKDLDFENRYIHIRNKDNFQTKTGKNMKIPMNDDLYTILTKKEFIRFNTDPDSYVFPNCYRLNFTKSYISRRFKTTILKANLSPQLHFHSLRHSFVTRCLQNNVPIYKVMKLVGHSNIKTTMIYTHLFVDDLRAGAEMITLPQATMQLNN